MSAATLHHIVPTSNRRSAVTPVTPPLTLSSVERMDAATYMQLAYEYLLASINDAANGRTRVSPQLLAYLRRHADRAVELRALLTRDLDS